MSRALLAAMLLPGCILSVLPLSDDFSQEPPEQALALTIERLSTIYSFTDWKRLDWADIEQRLQAELAVAEGQEDIDRVFRRLVSELPDGHVSLWNDDPARDLCPEAAGSLGLWLSDTDDGDVIVVQVEDDSPASRAGVQSGDVVVAWGGQDIEAALAGAPLHCFPIGLATQARRRSGAMRLLGRGVPGAVLEVTLSRGGQHIEHALTAATDRGDLRSILDIEPPEERISSRMLTDDVGLVAVGWEDTVLSEAGFRAAVAGLWRDGARKLVVDLRSNDGGTDQTAANIVGVFAEVPWFYETITMYDRRSGGQVPISEVWVEPQEIFWDLPVAVLVNESTVSSGEGMAMMFARLGIPVVGFSGTAASFGSSGSATRLPGGWSLVWPAGVSLDADGVIQLDSDHTLEGGVLPTHRIPWTAENRIAHAADPVGFAIDYTLAEVLR